MVIGNTISIGPDLTPHSDAELHHSHDAPNNPDPSVRTRGYHSEHMNSDANHFLTSIPILPPINLHLSQHTTPPKLTPR